MKRFQIVRLEERIAPSKCCCFCGSHRGSKCGSHKGSHCGSHKGSHCGSHRGSHCGSR
jgi:hypothetical protein